VFLFAGIMVTGVKWVPLPVLPTDRPYGGNVSDMCVAFNESQPMHTQLPPLYNMAIVDNATAHYFVCIFLLSYQYTSALGAICCFVVHFFVCQCTETCVLFFKKKYLKALAKLIE
jgi:hypothetical protein